MVYLKIGMETWIYNEKIKILDKINNRLTSQLKNMIFFIDVKYFLRNKNFPICNIFLF